MNLQYLVDRKFPIPASFLKLTNSFWIPFLVNFIMCSINSITVKVPSFSPTSWAHVEDPSLIVESLLPCLTFPTESFNAPFQLEFSALVSEYDNKQLFNHARWSTFRVPPRLSGIEVSGNLCGSISFGTISILSLSFSWRKFEKNVSTALNQSGGEMMKTFLSLAG